MRARVSALVAALATAAVLPIAATTGAPVGAAPATELFFSEYVEGSSNNKALEIYNGTGSAIDLTAGGYAIQQFSNGSSSAGLTINLTGTVAAGDVYVVAHSSAVGAITGAADLTSGAGLFNGDDALVLVKGATVIDAIGQVGFDPGTEWGSGLVSTADNTLRRKADVCAGDTVANDVFDPAVEWDGFATDTFDGLGAHSSTCDGLPSQPVINEFSASTAGTDVEYVELHAEASTDLSAYTVLEIEGDAGGTATGTIDEVIPAGMTDANGLWLASLPANALENGSITLLLVEGFTGAAGNDLDTDDDGVLDATPWTAIVDAVAVNDGGTADLAYGVPVLTVGYDGLPFAPGGASRIPDGLDTDAAADWVRNDFDLAGIPGFTGTPVLGEAINTPGAPNQAVEPPPPPPLGECGDPFTATYAIQGSGLTSPIVGTPVNTEGIVVGDFQTGGFDGFYIQDATGDGDAATSDGLFVYAPGAVDVAIGDHVRVGGDVVENFALTEIAVTGLAVCSVGNSQPDPTPVTLPVTTLDDLERFEGMRVILPQDLVITEYFNFDRFGEIVLSTERQFQPTALHEPGSPEAIALDDLNRRSRITLDDGRNTQNPDPAIHPNGAEFTLSNLFRGGDLVGNASGVLDFRFGLYRVQPTAGADYTAVNARPDVPDVGGSLTVASFNVLNYFTTIDTTPGDVGPCGPSGTLDCRGADTEEELARQQAKIVAAITAIDADVVGLIEIQNDEGEAVATLVEALNAAGTSQYAYIDTGFIGTDAIKVALIYQPASVSPEGEHAILDESVDPRFLDDENRPALAQTFRDVATGGVVTVTVNHLKSKGSDCNDIGDPDTGDFQGNCNLTRLAAAQALVDWLATDPTGSGVDANLIIGDLNSYDKEDPIDAIVAGADDTAGTGDDYTDLVALFGGEHAYSYVFDGQLGYLDHALAGAGLLADVTGAAVWHINADEPDLIDYDMTFKQDAQDALFAPDAYRSSDHDPVLVGLDLCEAVPPTLEIDLSHDVLWPPNHKYVTVEATVTVTDNHDPNPTFELVSVTSSEPDDGDDDGNTVNDVVIVDDTTFKLRAERSGSGTGRVYTVTYLATDSCGNTAMGTDTVLVPLSLGD